MCQRSAQCGVQMATRLAATGNDQARAAAKRAAAEESGVRARCEAACRDNLPAEPDARQAHRVAVDQCLKKDDCDAVTSCLIQLDGA